MRIVSLIASATEIVCALGLRDQLVGISHECDYPADVRILPALSEPKVDPRSSSSRIDSAVRDIARDGLSVYRVRTDLLESLEPDLIVTQDHCEVCAVSLRDVEAAVCSLTRRNVRICTLHPGSLDDVARSFRQVAEAAGVPDRGAIAAEFLARLERVRAAMSHGSAEDAGRHPAPGEAARPRVACLEWLDPVMVAGGWMPELVRIAGGEPVIVTDEASFKTVTWADLEAADPDVVVVMPCGFPIEQSLAELESSPTGAGLRRLRAASEGRCYVADGNAYFNRPGPRIADSAEILADLLRGRTREGIGIRWL